MGKADVRVNCASIDIADTTRNVVETSIDFVKNDKVSTWEHLGKAYSYDVARWDGTTNANLLDK